jgi:pimeloyl-ACP methyl ester carboxylesterase
MVATSERIIRLWNESVTARVKVAGQGPALAYLHNGYGLVWDECLDLLARDFTVYAPEHPGTSAGDPDSIKALDDLWDLVLYYYELFDKLGLEAPHVAGHSFGGMVAAELAATNSKRVGKLVLIDPLGLWRDDAPIKNYMVATQAELDPLFFHDQNHPARKLVYMNPEEPDSVIRVTWALGCTGKFIWPIPDKGLRKRIHRITAPTLIVWGMEDGLTRPLYAEEFQHLIPGARIEMVANAAHMAPLEQPAAVARLIREFLKS